MFQLGFGNYETHYIVNYVNNNCPSGGGFKCPSGGGFKLDGIIPIAEPRITDAETKVGVAGTVVNGIIVTGQGFDNVINEFGYPTDHPGITDVFVRQNGNSTPISAWSGRTAIRKRRAGPDGSGSYAGCVRHSDDGVRVQDAGCVADQFTVADTTPYISSVVPSQFAPARPTSP